MEKDEEVATSAKVKKEEDEVEDLLVGGVKREDNE